MAPSSEAAPAHPRARAPHALLATILILLAGAMALAPTAEAQVPRTFFGVSAVRPTPSDFEKMGELGTGSYRVEISWPSVQASRNGPFEWGGPDSRFRLAAAQGVRPTPIIFGAPAFVTGDAKHIRGPVEGKKQRRQWKDFAAAALERYGPGGTFWLQHPTLDPDLAPRDWVIWNEQNARAFWHPKASPKQYGVLLRNTRAAFDTVNPSARMIVGGMYGFPRHRKSMAAKKFLKRLYRQRDARRVIDGVSVHPYAPNMVGLKRQAKDARKIMNRAGDRRATLWVGETGWASAGPKKSFVVKNKKTQARLLEKVYRLFLVKRRKWRVGGVFWFTWRDYGGARICNWCPNSGLLNRRSKLKPAGEAFEALIARKVG
jgi:hypothetical protein